MKRHVLIFQNRFAPAVKAGSKPNTIRPPRKVPIRVGDELDLRAWRGKPYRSKKVKLRTAVCTRVRTIKISRTGNFIVSGRALSLGDQFLLAARDGFWTPQEMFNWFENMHGLPFTGVLIEWKP